MKLFRLALSAAIAFFCVNFMGFIDTFTVSTEGCGKDYPFCNGKLVPDFANPHAVIEYSHRLVVLIGMILLVLTAVLAWRTYRTRTVKALVLVALGGVLAEATLGALAVFFNSPPLIMAGHIGIALLSFASLLNLAFLIRRYETPPTKHRVSRGFIRFAWFSLVYLYLAIYFGAFVASSGSGGLFEGTWFPAETYAPDAFLIDLVHRGFAAGLVIISILLVFWSKRQGRFAGISIACLVLVLLQGVSGILMVATHLNLYVILLLVSDVSLLFGLMSLISVQASAPADPRVKGEIL